MRIGLISDTHGYLDPRVFEYFRLCDEIWHAGDLGEGDILGQLEMFKPVRAVYGNIDDKVMQARLPENLHFTCEGLKVLITHIGGTPPRYNPRVRKLLASDVPDIFICGHSHILRIGRDETRKNILYINPGAAGNQGFHRMRTIVRFTLENREIRALEVIELGKRGQIT